MGTGITLFQAITLGIALLGAVLGVINTWRSLSKSRIRLKVVPAYAIPVGAADRRLEFAIEITNLSAFAVTVYDAGVFFHGTKRRGAILNPVFSDGGQWPRRLEPRSSVSVYSQIPESPDGHRIRCAYAKTQCGHTQTGTSPALKQIANEQAP